MELEVDQSDQLIEQYLYSPLVANTKNKINSNILDVDMVTPFACRVVLN